MFLVDLRGSEREASGSQNTSRSPCRHGAPQSPQSTSKAGSDCFRLMSGNPVRSLLQTVYPDMRPRRDGGRIIINVTVVIIIVVVSVVGLSMLIMVLHVSPVCPAAA